MRLRSKFCLAVGLLALAAATAAPANAVSPPPAVGTTPANPITTQGEISSTGPLTAAGDLGCPDQYVCFYKQADWGGTPDYKCGLTCVGSQTFYYAIPEPYNRSAKNRYANNAVRVYRATGPNVGCMDPGENLSNMVNNPPPKSFRVFGSGSSCDN